MELRIVGTQEELAEFLKALGTGKVIAKSITTTNSKAINVTQKTVTTSYLAKKYNVTPQCIRTYTKVGMPSKKNGNTFEYDEADACAWIDDYIVKHPSKTRSTKYGTRKQIKEVSDYTKWRRNISNICHSSGLDEGKLLSETYKYMTKTYGIVWEQLRKDFYNTNKRRPASTLELAYALEHSNNVYTNLLEGCIDTVIKESK